MLRSPRRAVVTLLLASALASAGFVALYAAHPDTQLLGLALGGALCLLAAAAVVAGKRLVRQETITEDRPVLRATSTTPTRPPACSRPAGTGSRAAACCSAPRASRAWA